MAIPLGIEPLALPEWENKHANFKQALKANASFKLHNPALPSGIASYNATTANFQWLIGHAIDNNLRLRALGRGWSMSKVNVSEGGLVDTMSLRLSFNMGPSMVLGSYSTKHDPHNLFFTQCGMSVSMLNEKLEKESDPRRSLRASGAANGQSIVGAFSTNTHGGAWNFGAVHDQVKALHLVVGRNKHVWLERASYPIVSKKFVDLIGATLVRDDDQFNSAVVSFGSMGFIHGVLLEGEPIFLLEEHRKKQVPYNADTKACLDTLDFSRIAAHLPYALNAPGKELYHFEVGFNPHRFAPNEPDKGLFLRTIYKTPYTSVYDRRQPNPAFEYGDNVFGVLQTILDRLGGGAQALVPALVNTLYPLAYTLTEPITGTVGEIFDATRVRGKAASLALGLDIGDSTRVMELVVNVNQATAFPGVTAMRYVKGTQAVLGFTRFPFTCVMELDGVDCEQTHVFYRALTDELERQGVRYTLHWGKINYWVDEARLEYMYGTAAIDTWVTARNALLDADARAVFTNAFMEGCGLDKEAGVIV